MQDSSLILILMLRGLWTGNLERYGERAGDGASFSMQELHRGIWGGGGASFPWGLGKICNGAGQETSAHVFA
jgi:hypothetical protein